MSTAGSASSDRVCADCEEGTYTSGENQSACVAEGECDAGTVQTAPGSVMAPPTCEACSAGSYCAGGEAPSVVCPLGTWDHDQDPATECVDQTDCLAGEYIADEGSTTADRDCATCDTGQYSTTQNASACTDWTECMPGEYVLSTGSATTDRACAPCDEETYSTEENQASCLPWGECAAGTEQTAPGNDTAPPTCEACSIGYYCAGGEAPGVPCAEGTSDHDDDPATECVAASSSYGAEVLADSPYIFWRMNETSGTTMVDSSGNGRHGSSYDGGVSFGVAGIADTAVQFDGTTGNGLYPPAETLNGTFSVELWVKPTLDGHAVLFTTWGVSGGAQFDIQRFDGHPYGDIGTGSGWLVTAAVTTTPIPLNQWTHVVFVVTPDGWIIYQNGVQTASNSFSGTPLLFDTSTPLTVASHGSSLRLGGMMDEVAIYTTALSAERVAAHYAAANL